MDIYLLGIFLQLTNVKRTCAILLAQVPIHYQKNILILIVYNYSNSVCFVSFPKKITDNTPMTMATQKIAKI